MNLLTGIFGGLRMLILLSDTMGFNIGGKIVEIDTSQLNTPEKVDAFIAELDASKDSFPDFKFQSPVNVYLKSEG